MVLKKQILYNICLSTCRQNHFHRDDVFFIIEWSQKIKFLKVKENCDAGICRDLFCQEFTSSRRSFKNYVDKILTIFDYQPTLTWTFFTLNVEKKKYFLTTYPPYLVHIVFERPPAQFISITVDMQPWAMFLNRSR